MSRCINRPVPLMRTLQQLCAQSRQYDLASFHFHLRRNLSGEHLLQFEPADMQVAMRLNREKWRRALRRIGIGIQDAVPREFGGMRREPFGEISGRKLVGRKIELKHASWSRAMTRRCNPAAPMSASGTRRNLLHPYRVRSESHGR